MLDLPPVFSEAHLPQPEQLAHPFLKREPPIFRVVPSSGDHSFFQGETPIKTDGKPIHRSFLQRTAEVHGFRLFDCVAFQGKPCFVFGRRSSGYFDLRTLDGTKVHASASAKKLQVVQRASAL